MKPANLIAGDAEEANAITAALGFEGDLEEAKGKADADRAATLRQRLRQNARRNARTFDAMEFALSLGDVELADFVPTMGWHGDPATGRQKRDPRQVRRRSRHHSPAKARRRRCSTSSSSAAISASPAPVRCSGCASSVTRSLNWPPSRRRSSSSMRSGATRRAAQHETVSLSRTPPAACRSGRSIISRTARRRGSATPSCSTPRASSATRASPRRKPRRSSSRGPRWTV